MRRVNTGQRIEIVYEPGDRVKLIGAADMERTPCTVLYPVEYKQVIEGGKSVTKGFYKVRLDSGAQLKVQREAIWKEADTGNMGRVEHV